MARGVFREAKAMTREEVIVQALAKKLSWIQASEILGITARQMRRLKERYERSGYEGLVDGRGGRPRRRRVATQTIEKLCELYEKEYGDYSVRHFWEKATEEHGLEVSYTTTLYTLQAAGLVAKTRGRGTYRRRRPRRELPGMMLHLDASTHEWIAGQPMYDLVVMLDDADGRILYARFVPEEGTLSTLQAVHAVVRRYGRFCELYTDRGSHFCHTNEAGGAARTDHQGQVSRALRTLGIRQILAYSPQARGRSERAFRTIQGRLPQELRKAGIDTYADANVYLERRFMPDFNRRFTVAAQGEGSAFVKLIGIDLDLVLSAQHERVVQNDSTVQFRSLRLQLPPSRTRPHYVRCPVIVHEFVDGTLGVSYQGRLLARYHSDGQLLEAPQPNPQRRAARREAPVALRAPSTSRRARTKAQEKKKIEP